jgi:ABC-type multidrug transport system fused ATPase/permease subunit
MTTQDAKTRFVAEEKRQRGGFGLGFYARYFRSMRGLALFGPPLLVLTVVDTFFANGFRWLVALRAEGCTGQLCETRPSFEVALRRGIESLSEPRYLWMLGCWIFAGIFIRAVNWTGALGFLSNGGRALHDDMVDSLSRVRVSFFDENPTGRIVRRFSGDYSQLKHEIPNYVVDIITSVLELAWVLVLVLLQAPLAALACFPCGFLYFRIQSLYKPASRETQRLSKILETPVWSLFTESVAGYQTIRAYGRAERFTRQLDAHVRRAAYGALAQSRLTRWLNVRLKLTSELFGLSVALFICWSCASGRMGVGTAGFLMSLTIGLDVTMQWLTRTLSLIEGTMVSLERILEYRDLPHEATPAVAKGVLETAAVRDLVLENLVASYRADLPLVLKGASGTLKAGRRVGIIGKTGAGKSTLFQAFYRMLHVHSGRILYGGIDLADLDIREARRLFGIVPQEPHVFSGTLRFNLDRLGEHTDDRLWDVLRRASLETFVKNLPGGLDAPVYERGANFSVGERQLLCLARAALLKAPVMLMDEPTSSVDKDTDILITESARTLFAGRTLCIIAHRLETVLSCDEVFLIDDGRVVCQGAPAEVTETFLKRFEGARVEDALS